VTERAFEQWQRNPVDLSLLSRWVSAMQQQSQQESAIERLAPIAAEPLEENVSAGVYTALFQLELDLGHIQQANEWVNQLDAAEPESFRAPYFRGLILQQLNRLEEAKAYFQEAVKRDRNRVDSWKGLVDCCANTRDFERGLAVVQQARRVPWSPRWRRYWTYKQGCMYQQMARYALALVSFSEIILDCVATGMPQQVASIPRLSQVPPSAPLAALSDAIRLLEGQGLQAFPTAGTLLGWWREGKFLAHDKDVDIMLPPGSDWQRAIAAVSGASEFGVAFNEMGYSNFISFIHRETRLVVDLSQHEETDEGRIQCVWRIPGLPDEQCRRTLQSPYHLVRDQWLGCEFWRPEDPDRYLTDLYGDWRTPMVNFDTVISGQHLVGFPDMVRCYAYNRLAHHLTEGNRDKGLAYVSQILDKDPLDPLSNHVRNVAVAAQQGKETA
jgi:tetratricopeptide (TPR) repeat protein